MDSHKHLINNYYKKNLKKEQKQNHFKKVMSSQVIFSSS